MTGAYEKADVCGQAIFIVKGRILKTLFCGPHHLILNHFERELNKNLTSYTYSGQGRRNTYRNIFFNLPPLNPNMAWLL